MLHLFRTTPVIRSLLLGVLAGAIAALAFVPNGPAGASHSES